MVQWAKSLRWGLLAVAVVGLVIVSGCSLAEQGSNIGVIDIEKIVRESPKAQGYQKQLADKLEELQARAQEETADLDEEAAEEKQKEIYQEYLTLKQDLEGRLENEINTALKEVVQQRNIDIVMYQESVRFGGEDVTDPIIERLK